MISLESNNIHSCSSTCELKECVEARATRAKRVPRLEQWQIINWGTCSVAEGFVYGNPQFEDGTYIKTSYLRRYSLSEGKVTTKNNTYFLGTPMTAPIAEEDVIVVQ